MEVNIAGRSTLLTAITELIERSKWISEFLEGFELCRLSPTLLPSEIIGHTGQRTHYRGTCRLIDSNTLEGEL